MRLLGVLFLLLVSFSVVQADTIVITSGSAFGFTVVPLFASPTGFNFSGDGLTVQFSGEGFRINDSVPIGGTATVSSIVPVFPSPPQSIVFRGVLYEGVRVGGSLIVDPMIFVVPSLDVTQIIVPFTLTGVFGAREFATDNPIFSVDLIGSGLATIRFGMTTGTFRRITGATYNFATPESSSLLLMVTALSGLVVMMRRRMRR